MHIPNLPNIDPKLFRAAIIVSVASIFLGSWFWFQGRPTEIVVTPTTIAQPETELSKIYVHVAGKVAVAGVYELDAGSRVIDAIAAAGGATKSADLTMLNLARVLFDGEQILVGNSTQQQGSNKISINQADAVQLDQLPGIGPAIAARIIEYREQHGPFLMLTSIKYVSGIGDALFAKIKDLIVL